MRGLSLLGEVMDAEIAENSCEHLASPLNNSLVGGLGRVFQARPRAIRGASETIEYVRQLRQVGLIYSVSGPGVRLAMRVLPRASGSLRHIPRRVGSASRALVGPSLLWSYRAILIGQSTPDLFYMTGCLLASPKRRAGPHAQLTNSVVNASARKVSDDDGGRMKHREDNSETISSKKQRFHPDVGDVFELIEALTAFAKEQGSYI